VNILIVDDEPVVLECLRRVLTSLGSEHWDVVCANSGRHALEVMAAREVDLIITDMRMPGMGGAELLLTTAERWPHITRFALSGDATEVEAIRAAGVAHQFLGKPCRPHLMVSAINQVEGLTVGAEAAAIRAVVSAVPRLPALPSVFLQLRAALADPHHDVRTIADIVRQDPGIAAKIMQLASSSFFFRGSAISDIQAAVGRLGFSLISRLVLVEGLLASGPLAHQRFGYADEARRFFEASMIAEVSVSPSVRDDASLAVLLCPIGRSLMIAADPAAMERAMERGGSLIEAEREVFGTSHAAIGAHLTSLWGLPPLVSAAIAAQHTPSAYVPRDEVLAAVFLANRDVRGSELPVTPDMAPVVAAWDRHRARQRGAA
jgi:HD-like signal output (HDOD) protein